MVRLELHKVIQCNQVRRYAQGTYNQDHVRIEPAAVPEKEQALVGTINQERRTEDAVCPCFMLSYEIVCYDKVSYLPAIPDTRLWKDGAADCFSMYGNELPRVVLIRIRIEKGSEASLAFQGIEEELRLRTLDRTQEVVSHNGDSSPVMCCKDIFLGYVTLPANDKTRRLEYGALAWRLERRLLNVIFITLRTAYVR
ncbi:hypothetical protein TIFTF001_048093 [Ficus carica]|uniref:Uncharacterized protein n=2 Tax=Ficus carica TaxID=3494 RepID=A0AA87ZE99_FICCA|nr:hypothetical protein TIFTF001_048093 [Ficus carica]